MIYDEIVKVILANQSWFEAAVCPPLCTICPFLLEKKKLITEEIGSFLPVKIQKQPPRGVLKKWCSENMQQIYRRTPMSNCDFNKVPKQLY